MQPMLVGALLALSAAQTEATWGPNTWWGFGRSASATTTAPAAKGLGWGWNWGSSWGTKPASASLWGSCPQGKWQWRTGCRAIPECAPGQAWKGWAAGCCKNECPRNQTWDPRTGLCCAVPTCPAGQGWKGWARGCSTDTPKTVPAPVGIEEYFATFGAQPTAVNVPTASVPVPAGNENVLYTGEEDELVDDAPLTGGMVVVDPNADPNAPLPPDSMPVPAAEDSLDEGIDGEVAGGMVVVDPNADPNAPLAPDTLPVPAAEDSLDEGIDGEEDLEGIDSEEDLPLDGEEEP